MSFGAYASPPPPVYAIMSSVGVFVNHACLSETGRAVTSPVLPSGCVGGADSQ